VDLEQHNGSWNIRTANSELDNAEAVHGMPVSLQLVANRLEEEKVVAMARVVLREL
jgi:Asp-tRNA(Asn)/Glu-tRNA(Gln) amidotransferase A subunit family amidase